MERTNVRAVDSYAVYRPMLDLIGKSEGTDRGGGYNETLGYGAYTGGDVKLVTMTLKQIDDLQARMLAHPKNKWNSSAVGRYQIVRTTRRNIQKALSLPVTAKFDADMQDRMACYLLGQRGIDKWLAGRLKLDSLIGNLAREWASLPTSKGKGFYGGQNASVSVSQVKTALGEVARRHQMGQPKIEVPVEKPVVPEAVEEKARKTTGLWQKITGLFGAGGIGAALLAADWKVVAVVIGGVVVLLLVVTLFGRHIVAGVKDVREGLS